MAFVLGISLTYQFLAHIRDAVDVDQRREMIDFATPKMDCFHLFTNTTNHAHKNSSAA
jgi:hypothetical protein